jgi:glutamate synthase (ferredoxin)
VTDPAEITRLRDMIKRHADYTQSALGYRVLLRWDELLPKFVKVYPRDYKRMMEALAEVNAKGLSGDEAVMAAFEINKSDVAARVAGN